MRELRERIYTRVYCSLYYEYVARPRSPYFAWKLSRTYGVVQRAIETRKTKKERGERPPSDDGREDVSVGESAKTVRRRLSVWL